MSVEYDTILGYRVPRGTIPCWVIYEPEKNNALTKNEPFQSHTRPSCYFKLIQRLDNSFIQGYIGHIDNRDGSFHQEIQNRMVYMDTFLKREPVYFSFDHITLYKLLEIIPTMPFLTFTLKRIDYPQSVIANQAFMIMPFKDKELNDFYSINIKDYLKEELQINVLRADDFNGNDIIIDTIYHQIELSEFIITETSHLNKNVFFEFGYAAAKNKEIITIQNTEVEQYLFFDRAHIRAIFYSLNFTSEFQKQLKNSIIAIREKVASKN